jgi:predicted NACHT family NTPase
MPNRGLKASTEGINAAKIALTDKTWSQHKLAAAIGITRQPVSRFFAGETVSRTTFVQICQKLGLSWQMVAGLSEDDEQISSPDADIDTLLREVRYLRQEKISYRCGTMQMLDIAPIALTEIYTSINVFEEISSQRWQEISDLSKEKYRKRLPVLEAISRYSKLMLLGKPGSGKTSFLQYLAIQCNNSDFLAHRIPIFICLKEFAEDSNDDGEFNLFNYISQEFISCGIASTNTEKILNQGKGLILLDGLDEVPNYNREIVTREIRRFFQTYYQNQFVITCRLAEYKYRFQGFTEVEVADFHHKQIKTFAKKWFVAVQDKSKEDGEATGNLFINQLNLSENQQIRELAVTPIFLHFICLVFHYQGEFPSNRVKLYEQLLNILLIRWDESRGIKRDYLNILDNIQLMNEIAYSNFEQGNYYFEQYPIEVTHGLLVERARGIYSFSHSAFQEYFTAKQIVDTASLQNLVTRVTQKRWCNIFLLTARMLPNADEILQLMKSQVDSILKFDKKLQDFLTWLEQKSNSVLNPYKKVAIRAFYLVCDRAFNPTLNYDLESALVGRIVFDYDLAIDEFLASTIACAKELDLVNNDSLVSDYANALIIVFDKALEIVVEPELKQSLQILKEQLPFKDWEINGKGWTEQLRIVMNKYRNIGYDWQFNQQQRELLNSYYNANKLLLDCLKCARYVTPTVREEIEQTLLLGTISRKQNP